MSEARKVTVGLIQSSVSLDLELNLDRAIKMAEEAVDLGAEIICLPELFRTPYFPQFDGQDASAMAETIPGESTRAFSKLARDREVVVIVPLYEKSEGQYYNSAVVIDADGRLLKTYRKVHIPHDPLFYEKSYFHPGEGYQVYHTRYGCFAVLICYDQWFPEAARSVALQGADIIFYPTAIGWIRGERDTAEGDWREAWETVQRAHAIANGLHVAAVNRVGWEGDLLFWGSSFISDSFGQVLTRAGEEEGGLVAELNLSKNRDVRDGWGFLRNRRPETYKALLKPVSEVEGAPTPSPKRTLSLKDTPFRLGYHMPAEWEKHEAIWLSWPHDILTFPDIKRAEQAYVSIIREIHKGEMVNLLVADAVTFSRVAEKLKETRVSLERVRLYAVNYADVWFRDYGPTFVVNRKEKKLAMVTWTFNAWGEKYPELMLDSRIPCLINDYLKLSCFKPGIVLEGGSIEANGQGTVITTEQCLLNKNRNPELEREEIELYLLEYLGASKVIWLKEGIAGDDTDGHVDDIARFVDPNTVLCAYEEDEGDENCKALKENYEILSRETDQDGRPLRVIKLPMPGRVGGENRLPASYANFYISNEVVLVPVFGHPNDQRALGIIQDAFPDRRVVGIDAQALVLGLGTIHCISQQQPSV